MSENAERNRFYQAPGVEEIKVAVLDLICQSPSYTETDTEEDQLP